MPNILDTQRYQSDDNLETRLETTIMRAISTTAQTGNVQVKIVDDSKVIVTPTFPTNIEVNEATYFKIYDVISFYLAPKYSVIRTDSMQLISESTVLDRSTSFIYYLRPGGSRRLIINNPFTKPAQLEIPLDSLFTWNIDDNPHALISGATGSGKSYFMSYLARYEMALGDLIVIDPKSSNLARLARHHNMQYLAPVPAENTAIVFADTAGQLLSQIVLQMEQRQQALFERQSIQAVKYTDIGYKPVFIMFDELAAALKGLKKDDQAKIQEPLMQIALKGREAGVYLGGIGLQQANAQNISTELRDQFNARFLFGKITEHNAQFLFPEYAKGMILPQPAKGSGIFGLASNLGIEPYDAPTYGENFLL